MKPLFRAIGATEDVTACDCCGRMELRSTVELEHLPSGEHVWFGRECANGAVHPWAALSPKYAAFIPAAFANYHDEPEGE